MHLGWPSRPSNGTPVEGKGKARWGVVGETLTLVAPSRRQVAGARTGQAQQVPMATRVTQPHTRPARPGTVEAAQPRSANRIPGPAGPWVRSNVKLNSTPGMWKVRGHEECECGNPGPAQQHTENMVCGNDRDGGKGRQKGSWALERCARDVGPGARPTPDITAPATEGSGQAADCGDGTWRLGKLVCVYLVGSRGTPRRHMNLASATRSGAPCSGCTSSTSRFSRDML